MTDEPENNGSGEDEENQAHHLEDLSSSLPRVGRAEGKYTSQAKESFRSSSEAAPSHYVQALDSAWLSGILHESVARLDRMFDYEVDSYQRKLLLHLAKTAPDEQIWKKFEAAKSARHTGIRNLVSRALVDLPYADLKKQIRESALVKTAVAAPNIPGMMSKAREVLAAECIQEGIGKTQEILGPREFALVRLATVFPEQILPSDGFREMLDTALLGGRGADVIRACAKVFENAARAKKELGIDPIEFEMTLNWTNPDFPLWLGESGALAEMLRLRFGLEDVTEDGVKKMRSRKLESLPPHPIVDFRAYRDGQFEFDPPPDSLAGS